MGLPFSATRGIVSAKALEFQGRTFIQVDAAINPGCSGGPLLDRSGQVVGLIAFLLKGGDSLSFAVPIDQVMSAARMALDTCSTELYTSCPACGNMVDVRGRFCVSCGKRLSRDLGVAMLNDAALLVGHTVEHPVSTPGREGVAAVSTGAVRVRQMINALIDGLGLDSYAARVDRDRWSFTWDLQRGEVGLATDLTAPDLATVWARFALMSVPPTNVLAFYRRLLELNREFLGNPAFAVDDTNTVWLMSGRPIQGLDSDELQALLVRTRDFAEQYDRLLLEEFASA